MRSRENYRLEVRPSTDPDIIKEIYEASFFPVAGMQSSSVRWIVDVRVPLGNGRLLRPLAAEMAAVLAGRSVSQVAGAGFGAFLLVGGILAIGTGMQGGLIRELPKPYGFQRLVEGGLNKERPIFIIDDVLSSGQTALRAAVPLREEGFCPVGVLTVFRYGWKEGIVSLEEAGLSVECLATLTRLPVHARTSP